MMWLLTLGLAATGALLLGFGPQPIYGLGALVFAFLYAGALSGAQSEDRVKW